ncbi:MAG: hypothetical protein ABI200_01310, partial [Gaiellales bacterium]
MTVSHRPRLSHFSPLLIAALALMITACGGSSGSSDSAPRKTDDAAVPTDNSQPAASKPSADGAGARAEGRPADTVPVGSCSAAGLDLNLPEQKGLPRHVEQTREQLFAAAIRCDFALLGEFANANPNGFSFTFGAAKDPAAYWKRVDAQDR